MATFCLLFVVLRNIASVLARYSSLPIAFVFSRRASSWFSCQRNKAAGNPVVMDHHVTLEYLQTPCCVPFSQKHRFVEYTPARFHRFAPSRSDSTLQGNELLLLCACQGRRKSLVRSPSGSKREWIRDELVRKRSLRYSQLGISETK